MQAAREPGDSRVRQVRSSVVARVVLLGTMGAWSCGASDYDSILGDAGAGSTSSVGSNSTLELEMGGATGGISTEVDFEACTGSAFEQELVGGPLDIYLIFDRTASMGEDCAYVSGEGPPVASKACFSTYALSDYLINVVPATDTRLAFQFMSLVDADCGGGPYATPAVSWTELPISAENELVQAISDEQFQGGLGTHIEGAFRGLAAFASAARTPGREMIGVLMTDGEPNGCEEDTTVLSEIVADNLAATGIRTFIIGMEGADSASLEQYAVAGGASPHDDWCADKAPPCHFWNVGDGSGDAISSALQAIVGQAAPLPCDYPVASLQAPAGETVDFNLVNVIFAASDGQEDVIGQVAASSQCPDDALAWYYDDPETPTMIHLCPNACAAATAAAGGGRINVNLGCVPTVKIQ